MKIEILNEVYKEDKHIGTHIQIPDNHYIIINDTQITGEAYIPTSVNIDELELKEIKQEEINENS